MEQELEFLREEVRTKSACVQRLQTSLYDQQVRANLAVVALRTQLRQKDRDVRQLRGEHEQRMSAMLSHLLYLEGQMRQEQRQVLAVLHDKDDVIRRQKSAIEDLASKNAKLLAALKEVHGYSGGNGISSPHTSSTATATGSAGGAGEAGADGVAVGVATPQPVVLRNKDKSQKVRFSSMKDKLRRHKSSLELHRPASLETLLESALRYGSQENLSEGGGGSGGGLVSGTSARGGGGGSGLGTEGLCSDELKKCRLQERKERCKSLVDYPSRLNDLPEVSSEVEKGRAEPPLTDPLHEQSLRSPISPHHPSSPPGGVREDSDVEEEEEEELSSACEYKKGKKQYGELAKSTSMPQSLSSASGSSEGLQASVKERPHSLSGVELSLNMDKMTMQPMERVSLNPSPTSLLPPGGSESSPFKSFKNVFRRRNSKQRSKKRPVSLGQQTNQEYHEALKEHFKKYDLS